MAIRLSSPNILKSIRYYTRPLNSAVSSSLSAVSGVSGKPEEVLQKPSTVDDVVSFPPSPPIFDLDDGEKIFAPLSTAKLLRSAAILHAAAVGPMVDFGTAVLRSKLMETPVVKQAILGTLKHTFYQHFCAGENTEEVQRTVEKLNEAGMRGMLVYALEYANDNVSCDRNLEAFLRTAEFAEQLPPGSVSSVIVKISAICPINLMERVSDLLRWQHKDSSFRLNWKMDTFPVLSESSPMYHTLKKPEHLTPEEENDLQLAFARLQKLCKKCADLDLPLLVDAEDTAVQPSIDYMTYASAIIYNKGLQHPIVYGTIQAYLRDAKERLGLAVDAAEKRDVALGVKLVRGAYMSSENKLATSLGYRSPIHSNIEATHECYNSCAELLIEKIAALKHMGVVLATHNVDSGKMAATKAKNMGIGEKSQRLEFAQLYGMSEALSFGLSSAGFNVSKYMPYGPVEMVMPYLLRRAEENRGLLSTSKLDRDLMRKELIRRFKNPFSDDDNNSDKGIAYFR